MPPFWRLWAVLSVARPPITVAAATTASYSSSPRPIIRTVRFGRARPSGRRALLGLTGFGLATWILSTRLDQLEGILDKALGDDTIHDLEQEEIDNEFQRVKAVYGSDTASKPNVDSNDGRILFLPLSRRRRSPTIRYSSNDPDWLSIVEFSANEDLKQTVLQALIDTVMSACLQQPLIARKLGPKPYSCRHMLEFQYLSLLSVGLEQDGLDITDTGIWYTTRYYSSEESKRLDRHLWPSAMYQAMSATALELADEYKDIALERWKSFTTSIGQRIGEQRRRIWPSSAPAPEVAGSDASPGAIEPPRKRKRRWTQEPPESADTQAGSSTSGTLGSNQAANESEARSFDVEGVKKYLSSLSTTPKPIRHISHNLAVSIRYGNRIDRNQSYHPPAGAVKLTGTIEVRSRQAYIPVVLTAWYDVREGKWDNISIDASSVKEHWVQRQPGVIRSRKPRETGADHKPDPSAAPANESDESKKDP